MVALLISVGLLALCWVRAVSAPAWIPLAVGIGCLMLGSQESPAIRLALASLILLYFVKASAISRMEERPRGLGAWIYATVWPGIAPDGLISRSEPRPDAGRRFKRGYTKFWMGLTLCLVISWFANRIDPTLLGAVGIVALLLTVHFGFSDMLTAGIQSQGWNVKPLFDDPFRAVTLNEFWSRRWNLAFVQMNRILFMRPLVRMMGLRRAVFGAFVISGILHELAISYPVMKGWGGPLAYFILQAALVAFERRLKLSGSLWTWVALLLPTPLLFHDAFRRTLVAPLFSGLGNWLHSLTFETFWSIALAGLGLLHFLILAASFQVPTRLNWREELGRLSPLNRKLMWTYGAFIVLCIVAFGVMTLALRPALLSGNIVGLWLCGFIAVFWGLRLIVDNFVLVYSDWPQGPEFEIGHMLLNTVFITLFVGYGGFIVLTLTK